ncbi:hypothetical protein ILYODFUR_003855 [Ilyodon furcidens]|uniref:Uncharacterized protein n=1 Tax=Ilyodon furcidens TaxID=33524 RepID=A0ABV0VAU3_9TELE
MSRSSKRTTWKGAGAAWNELMSSTCGHFREMPGEDRASVKRTVWQRPERSSMLAHRSLTATGTGLLVLEQNNSVDDLYYNIILENLIQSAPRMSIWSTSLFNFLPAGNPLMTKATVLFGNGTKACNTHIS